MRFGLSWRVQGPHSRPARQLLIFPGAQTGAPTHLRSLRRCLANLLPQKAQGWGSKTFCRSARGSPSGAAHLPWRLDGKRVTPEPGARCAPAPAGAGSRRGSGWSHGSSCRVRSSLPFAQQALLVCPSPRFLIKHPWLFFHNHLWAPEVSLPSPSKPSPLSGPPVSPRDTSCASSGAPTTRQEGSLCRRPSSTWRALGKLSAVPTGRDSLGCMSRACPALPRGHFLSCPPSCASGSRAPKQGFRGCRGLCSA